MPVPVMHRYGRRPGFDRFTFEVVPESSVDERTGKQITLKVGGFTPDPKLGLLEVANMAHYKGCLGYIAFWKDDWSTVEGSAAIIGPGVALTAFHVLSDLLPMIVAGDLKLMLFTPTPDGGRAWRIKNVTRVGETDLAILSLIMGSKMPRRRELNHLNLSALPPDPGELVMVSGFRAAEDVVEAEQGIYFPVVGTSIKHGMRLWRAVGKALPADHQDDLCLQVDVSSMGGMSGGAAFNSKGECFGILRSSIDHGSGAGTSRINLLWPALATEFPDHFLRLGAKMTLTNLEGVTIEGRDRLAIENILPGVRTVRLKTLLET
jgi:S1-C subfamily serine protease